MRWLRKPCTGCSTTIAGAERAAGTTHSTAAPRHRVIEPVTALLDLLTAVLCAAAGIHLLALRPHSAPLFLWAAMFPATAAAGIGGAVAVLLLTAWTPYTPWVLAAAAAAAAAAGTIQGRHITIHRRFSHNDLAHAVSLPAFWCLFRAGVLIGGGAG